MNESTKPIQVKVECYAGYKGEQTPRKFFLWEQELEVKEVIDQWLTPELRYFKIRANDGAEYILRNDMQTHEWELSVYSKYGI